MKELMISAHIFLTVAIAINLYEVIHTIIYFARDRKGCFTNNIIKWDEYVLFVGIAGSLCFTIIMIFCIFNPGGILTPEETVGEHYAYSLISFALSIPGLYLFLVGINQKCIVHDDFFIYVNCLGIKKSYKYDEVELKQMTASLRCYKHGTFQFALSPMQRNYSSLEVARQTYLMQKNN